MRYTELHEAAQFYAETKTLHNEQDEYIKQLYLSSLNYLNFADIDEDYLCVLALFEGIRIKFKQCVPSTLPGGSIAFEKGISKKFASIYHSARTLNDLEKQICCSGLFGLDRIKHAASKCDLDALEAFDRSVYQSFYEKHHKRFPEEISPDTAFNAIARMNRFTIIYNYMIEKFKAKYSPRIPRLDDYCKLLAHLNRSCTHEALEAYFDRFDTAKFQHVSIYSPWNVCYYQLLRNALLSLPDKILEKQFLAFKEKIKKVNAKKCNEDELIVFSDIKKALK